VRVGQTDRQPLVRRAADLALERALAADRQWVARDARAKHRLLPRPRAGGTMSAAVQPGATARSAYVARAALEVVPSASAARAAGAILVAALLAVSSLADEPVAAARPIRHLCVAAARNRVARALVGYVARPVRRSTDMAWWREHVARAM